MSFDGTEGFVAVDEDAVAANECEDTFIDNALRSNHMALRLLGHQVTWTPRTFDSDDFSQSVGIRPYASLARSSILSIPWIAQVGMLTTHIAIHCRVADEHGQNLSTQGNLTMPGITSARGERLSFTNSDGSTPEYKVEEATLELREPLANERITDLRIDQQPGELDTYTIDGSLNAHAVLRQGAYVSGNSSDDIMQQAAASPPDSGDRHLMVWYNQDENAVGDNGGQAFDFLWAAPADDFAYMRPLEANPYIASQDCELRPLPYVQVRAIEINETWAPDFDLRPQGRYAPDRVVDGRDAIEHAIVLDRIYRRKRCLWIGPRGTEGDSEIWPGGYGEKFARVAGSTSATSLFSVPPQIQPRTKNPKILVLLNLLPTWDTPIGSVAATTINTVAALEKALEQAEWTFDVAIKRYADGSTTPGTIASVSEVRVLEHYPQLLTPLSAALISEDVIRTGNIGGALKEGQLFEEDHALIQRVVLEVELTGYDPSSNDAPCFVDVQLSTSSLTGLQFAEVPDDVSGLDQGDLVVTCTGATIWEAPQ